MDLRKRFALGMALVQILCLFVFSMLTYLHTKQNLLSSARASLSEHLFHERHHLHASQSQDFTGPSTSLQNPDISYRALRDGQVLFDTIPASLDGVLGPRLDEVPGVALVERIDERRFGHQYRIVAVLSLARTSRYLATLRQDLILAGIAAMFLLLPLSVFLAAYLLRPFRELAEKTHELTVEQLCFRFPVPKQRDDYRLLVENFNALLGRLEEAFRQVRRFATNASHELRTPITVIRGEAEIMLRKPRDVSDYEDALARIIGQAEALQRIVRRLLFLANLERVENEPTSTIEVVSEVRERLRVLAKLYEAKRPITECSSASEIEFPARPELFSSVLSNLLENAFKYSHRRVSVNVCEDDEKLTVFVDDDGPGIPNELRGQVFQPFFRIVGSGEKGDSEAGHGLGLSIVKACVDACRGAVRLLDSPLGGLRVEVTFPRGG